MERIAIALDYAPSSQKVAEQGYQIGKAMNADIILIHVIEDVGYYSSTVYDPIMGFGGFTHSVFLGDDIMKIVKKEAREFLESVKAHLGDDDIKVTLVRGNVADSILRVSKREKCSLMVLGTHGRNTFGELLLGSTSHKLIVNSTIPICLIPIKKT